MPGAWSSQVISLTRVEFYFPWNWTLVTCPTPVLLWNLPTTTGDWTTDFSRLPSLDVLPGGISLEINTKARRGGDVDRPLHPSLRGLHLQTRRRKSKRSKHSHKKRRRYTSFSSSSVSDNQMHDYGRYTRNRHTPQAVQNPAILQPKEVTNV